MSSTALATLTAKLASTLDMGDGTGLMETLKATAFRTKADGPQIGDAQMTALLIIANQYGLNPWTKEIYAFPDKNNGIVPVVGVDGWSRIINSHPQFDGMEFEQDEDGCTCIIYRKDRSHAVKVREYMVECFREGVGPWKSHPWRMLRHKAMIQCARLAFGFVGIFEQDEAERIVEMTDPGTGEITRKPAVVMPQSKGAAAPAAPATTAATAEGVTDVEVKEKPASAPADTALASPGEVAYILKKITAKNMTIEAAREAAGLDVVETLDGLTKDGFVALKDVLK